MWTKGGFDTRQLLDHLVSVLGHTLPLPDEPQPPRPPTEVAMTAAGTAERIEAQQVIEDNPQDMRLTWRLLESEGCYRVIEAASGRAGLKAVHEYQPDLVVLDLMLPEMDGFSVLQTLQSDPKLRDIPVVVLSAKELTDAERDQLAPQAASLVTKSALDRGQFLYLIQHILE